MADLRKVTIISSGPIKDGPDVHGADIGFVWDGGNVQVTVDYEQLHEKWVPIVYPPTWRDTGKQGWVKWSRCAEDRPGETRLLVTVYDDGRAPTVKVVG